MIIIKKKLTEILQGKERVSGSANFGSKSPELFFDQTATLTKFSLLAGAGVTCGLLGYW